LNLETVTPMQIWSLTHRELINMDEQMEFMFMSMHDSFTPLFFTKEANIEPFIKVMNVEVIICNEETKIDWFK
jgi:Protein of unknown function (DUF2711)